MAWQELNQSNIGIIKSLYQGYLQRNSNNLLAMTFEDFMADEIEKCAICDEWNDTHYLFDTETSVNGGIGMVCESCKDNMA